jgi:hypothetical protein
MMHDHGENVERLARELSEAPFNGGLKAGDLARIVGEGGQEGGINCYPGQPGGGCYEVAFFISLTSKDHKGNRRGHITCKQAIEKLVQHMQGYCAERTHVAILIVDSWDADAVSDWKHNLTRIQSEAQLEIFMVNGGKVTPVSI